MTEKVSLNNIFHLNLFSFLDQLNELDRIDEFDILKSYLENQILKRKAWMYSEL